MRRLEGTMLRRCAGEMALWLRASPGWLHRSFGTETRRTGLIAIKAGMTQDWDSCGAFLPLTVLWIDNCQAHSPQTGSSAKRILQVTAVVKKTNGEMQLELGCGYVKQKNSPTAVQRKYEQLGMPIKSKTARFKITEDAVLPVGTTLSAAHFVAGQYIDVKGTTLGKGFQGVMKRWGFAGGNASHGASKSHRSAGSIGACQDPGKVWKGKKMAGHMGCQTRVVHNVWIYRVDPSRNLIYVRGQVPGHKGNYVFLQDARLKPPVQNLPFPTHTGPLPEASIAEPEKDPYHLFQKGKV